MTDFIELTHACGAPAGEVTLEEAPVFINAGFLPEEFYGTSQPLPEDNSSRPCLTCPQNLRMAAQVGELIEMRDEIPKGCFYESIFNKLIGGTSE